MADLPAFQGRRIIRPDSLHHSRLPRRGQKPSSISHPCRRTNEFAGSDPSLSRPSNHAISRSEDFLSSIGSRHFESSSRRSSADSVSSTSSDNWLNRDSFYTSKPSITASPPRSLATRGPASPSRIPRRKDSIHSPRSSPKRKMAEIAASQVPSPPQSPKDDSIKVQTIASDPRQGSSDDAKGLQGSKDDSFVHVGDSKPPVSNDGNLVRAEFPAPAEVYDSAETKDEKEHSGQPDEEKATENGEDKNISDSNGGNSASSISYASALRKNLDFHDDSDSYPELDDMDAEMIHQPPKPKEDGGIRWVPWNVPFKRRGQTLAVLLHSLSIVMTVSFFCACCANPFVWPLLLIYLLHVLNDKSATDGSLRYRSERLRRSYFWHFFAGYFPAKLHKTHDLPPTRKYIFGYHPHGIISHGAWAAFSTDALGFSEKFPGITNTLLTLESNFRVPFYRDYLLGMGMRSVSRESIVNILTKGGMDGDGMGRGVTVVVGGARESLEAIPGNMRLILKERKGFVKIAVRTGADLVPVLAFGENNLYDQLEKGSHPILYRIQMFILKVWKFTLPFVHGRGIFNYDVGLMPYRKPLNVVVGAPIKVVKSATVDPVEIDRLHELYVAELEKLWYHYKDEFAEDRKEELQLLS